jgi:hypothetical protein
MYDGQGFWLCHKRLSQGRFPWWPSAVAGGTQRSAAHQLAVLLSAGNRLLCYCFGHSVATIEQELRTKGRSVALQDIRRKMQDPGCACEVKNPSGTCCLDTIRKRIEAAKSELRGSTKTGSRAETISKAGAY